MLRWRQQSSALARRHICPRLEQLRHTEGSAILEFAIAVPLLVVFVVGIYDFSGAFNQKQKIEHAAQEGAIIAAAQPMTDIVAGSTTTPAAGPTSLQPVVVAVFNSLAGNGLLPNANQGTCTVAALLETQAVLTYTYKATGCSNDANDDLLITINRGWVVAGSSSGTTTTPSIVGSVVTVSFPYHWRFNSVIQLLLPGASYQSITNVTESASVHNQM